MFPQYRIIEATSVPSGDLWGRRDLVWGSIDSPGVLGDFILHSLPPPTPSHFFFSSCFLLIH